MVSLNPLAKTVSLWRLSLLNFEFFKFESQLCTAGRESPPANKPFIMGMGVRKVSLVRNFLAANLKGVVWKDFLSHPLQLPGLPLAAGGHQQVVHFHVGKWILWFGGRLVVSLNPLAKTVSLWRLSLLNFEFLKI